MKLGKLLSVAAIVSLVATPVAAQQAQAERLPAPVSETERGGMGMPAIGWVIALLIAAGVALVILGDDKEDDAPVSP